MTEDIYNHVKRKLTEGELNYPELAMYETFIKNNADHWLKPKNANLVRDKTFGISVIPSDYNENIHDGISVEKINTNGSTLHTCLKHQCYLHNMLLKIWKGEANSFEILPVFKNKCTVS